MSALWIFRCYALRSGKDAIDDWYRCRSNNVQAAFDVTIEYLAQRPRHEWRRPEFDLLSGRMRGIGEIRFKADQKQFRVLGFFGPQPSEFTLLIGASKKGAIYDPKSALEAALRRKEEILSDGSRCRFCQF
jgi:hypothetical protein